MAVVYLPVFTESNILVKAMSISTLTTEATIARFIATSKYRCRGQDRAETNVHAVLLYLLLHVDGYCASNQLFFLA